MTVSTPPDRAGTVLGHYRIEVLLGRGGMGEVYRATDTVKGRVVALKLLNPAVADDQAFRDRFLRESRVAASINEPHVIPIHDWGEIDGLLFIDMRLVDGRDLGDLLTDGPLDPTRAVAITGQIADALDAAHAAGLVHRDVKPDNILVDGRDFAYLVDFGLAQADTDTRLTNTGTAVGSFGYMAPERFGDGAVGAPADIYALTCVLFECLAGGPPFGSATTIERLIAAHLTAPPPHLGGPIDQVIARGLAKNPAERYPSASALVTDARAALAGGPLAAPPTVLGAQAAAPPPTQYRPTGTAGRAPTHPEQWNPTQVATGPTPTRTRSPLLPVAIATIVVLLVGVGVLGWALLRPADDAATPAARSSATPASTAQTSTAPSVTSGQAPAPAPPQAPEPTTAAPTRGVGDLGLSTPITRPACDGTGIVIVGNAVNQPTWTSEVSRLLTLFPGSSYLRADQACPSLRSRYDDGTLIYAVYQVAGKTKADICALRARLAQTAAAVGSKDAPYGKWLDTTTDPTTFLAPSDCGQ